ncbi:CHAT domain-containing protein [Myceligenerans pegani]|uniref:CHAT domain-containing protein n=1 Tax=Myceligenerans pegani TaxID=2776917 RepID=A0ABR9MSA6_9MICO|nr:CHAT domain-containing protein [Myceligenerans sp. TRM 65318]MBE1874265.1 CHAT domain-containing protein [Myceligenerans sp. TRM 65318]MBE3016536.1 CHAT domain-containing protein [Myceligenerans sp. TRM 65318]
MTVDDTYLESLATRLKAARELNKRARWADGEAAFRGVLDEIEAIDVDRLDRVLRRAWDGLAVRGHLGLSNSVLLRTDSLDDAMKLCARAEELATASTDPSLRTLVQTQRGVLLIRTGSTRAALEHFSEACENADMLEDEERAILLLNRGNAHSELGMFEAALRDYEASYMHAAEAGNLMSTSFALGNIGYALYAMGDLPGALASMERSHDLTPDRDDGIPLLARAEVLFDSGLLEDAERLLRTAVEQLARVGWPADHAEAEWFHARCLLGLRQYDAARRTARRASRRFADAGNPSMAALAQVLELEAELAGTRFEAPTTAVARRRAEAALAVAEEGDGTGSFLGYHPGHAARLVAARWLVLAGDVARARRVFDVVGRDGPGTPLTFRIQRLVVAAQLAFAEHNRARGLRAVRQGFRLLAEHRSRLGAVESVTAAAVHGVDLALVDVGAALETGRPTAFFDALERGRSTFAGPGRVTPPDDPEAAELLAEARGLLGRARELPADGEHAAEREDLTRRAGAIQNKARERSWLHAGDAEVDQPVTARETVRALGGGAVVANFAVFGGRLRAVRVDDRGAVLLDLGEPAAVEEHVRRVRADIAVAANEHIPPPLRAAAQASLARSLKTLDDAVIAPLGADGDLHVVAREPLLGIPWTALPSRQGRRTSVNSHVARGRRDAHPGTGHRLLAAAGPGVAHGAGEAGAVGTEWPGATVLTGGSATTAAVREALATHDVVHLAAHGRHDADNPLFASIELADGPLFAHELDGMRLPGSVVVLAACEVGGSSEVVGGEVLGLTSVLLRLGARAVIAAVAPLPDALAAQVMPRFHAHLRTTDDPEAALAAACAEADQPVPLVCFAGLSGL